MNRPLAVIAAMWLGACEVHGEVGRNPDGAEVMTTDVINDPDAPLDTMDVVDADTDTGPDVFDVADIVDVASDPPPVDTQPVDTGCAAPRTTCGTACVDLTTDSNNCGACGNGCGSGTLCGAGSCRPCTPCAGSCVDLTSDPSNCGTCGAGCPSGHACVAGVCR